MLWARLAFPIAGEALVAALGTHNAAVEPGALRAEVHPSARFWLHETFGSGASHPRTFVKSDPKRASPVGLCGRASLQPTVMGTRKNFWLQMIAW